MLQATTLGIGIACTCLVACQDHAPARPLQPARPELSAPTVLATSTNSVPARETTYPPARWRLAPPDSLRNVSLWFSQILIRHAAVRTPSVNFCWADWNSPEPPARSREQALELARSLSASAGQRSADFAALARQYSEDIATRERGGSFGGVTAYYLLAWPQVLDALATLGPGETSAPVETEYGVHIFRRDAPPPEQEVSGAHLVIGHDQAGFLEVLQRRELFSRSREQGLAMARELRALAAADPQAFTGLVSQYSEHPDRVLGGDLGQWSTHEVTDYPTQLAVLRELNVGEVSQPIETLFGWELLLRTENRQREIYAMTPIEVHVASIGTNDEARADLAARTRASELAAILREHPERFDELQAQVCCKYTAQWPEGRGDAPLMTVLRGLQVGEIAAAPVHNGMSYVVPKRVPPTRVAPVPASFELPAPGAPDLAYVLSHARNDRLAADFGEIARAFREQQQLTDDETARLVQLQSQSVGDGIPGSAERSETFERLRGALVALLGEARFGDYLSVARRHFERRILSRGQD